MLLHQIYATEGIGNDAVKLGSVRLIRLSVRGPANSGIQLGSTGILSYRQSNGGLSQISGQWLIFGNSSTFYVQRTILKNDDGTLGTLETDAGDGFLQLSTTRTYTNIKSTIGVKTTEVFFEIASDASGVPVVATATMIFISEVTGRQ